MSVSQAVRVSTQPHRYREVEQGVSLFSAVGSVTGSTGNGTAEVQFNFNEDEKTGVGTRYIGITRCAVTFSGAAPDGNAIVLTAADHWDRGPSGGALNLATIQLLPTFSGASGTDYGGNWYGFVNAGRAADGTKQQIRVVSHEVNTAIMRAELEGFWSEHPIAGRWWLSA